MRPSKQIDQPDAGGAPARESFPLAIGECADHLERQIVAAHARDDATPILAPALDRVAFPEET